MFKYNRLTELKLLFEKYITISTIAEKFDALEVSETINSCINYMDDRNFDIIGVKENGCIIGYWMRRERTDGVLGDDVLEFVDDEIMPSTCPLPEALHYLAEKPRLFVKESGTVVGIITRADLHKPAVRIWLYGLISVLEIHMFELIREEYSGNDWGKKLSCRRRKHILKIHSSRKKMNEDIDLLYCTEFCDKRTIIEKSNLFKVTGIESKKVFSKEFKRIGDIRDWVAHSCKIEKSGCERVSELSEKIESIINNIEQFLCYKNSY